jgi:acetyl esterase/lipase
MKQWKDIAYAPKHGERGLLDISLPDEATACPIIMVIHGGALREFSKERMAGVVAWIVEQGWGAVNINYRLLPQSSFPAPLENTLAAFHWIKAGEHEALRRQDLSRVALLGASAGGFLALTAGFLLGSPEVQSIISISGPTLPHWYDKDVDHSIRDARLLLSPIELVGPNVPPVLAVHSRNDKLVPMEESIELVGKLQGTGRSASLYLFDGPGDLHGIWRNAEEPLQLFPHIERAISAFLRRHHETVPSTEEGEVT